MPDGLRAFDRPRSIAARTLSGVYSEDWSALSQIEDPDGKPVELFEPTNKIEGESRTTLEDAAPMRRSSSFRAACSRGRYPLASATGIHEPVSARRCATAVTDLEKKGP